MRAGTSADGPGRRARHPARMRRSLYPAALSLTRFLEARRGSDALVVLRPVWGTERRWTMRSAAVYGAPTRSSPRLGPNPPRGEPAMTRQHHAAASASTGPPVRAPCAAQCRAEGLGHLDGLARKAAQDLLPAEGRDRFRDVEPGRGAVRRIPRPLRRAEPAEPRRGDRRGGPGERQADPPSDQAGDADPGGAAPRHGRADPASWSPRRSSGPRVSSRSKRDSRGWTTRSACG